MSAGAAAADHVDNGGAASLLSLVSPLLDVFADVTAQFEGGCAAAAVGARACGACAACGDEAASPPSRAQPPGAPSPSESTIKVVAAPRAAGARAAGAAGSRGGT